MTRDLSESGLLPHSPRHLQREAAANRLLSSVPLDLCPPLGARNDTDARATSLKKRARVFDAEIIKAIYTAIGSCKLIHCRSAVKKVFAALHIIYRDEMGAATGLDPNTWFGNVQLVTAKDIGQETVLYVGNI